MNIWPWSTIGQLKTENARLVEECKAWASAYQSRSEQYHFLTEREATLRAQLAEAAKNDSRDPKTGRFVKAER